MDARLLDEIALAATPATVEADVAGWRCRAAPGLPFRRANSAVPPPSAVRAVDRAEALAQVRAWYADHGARLIIQVSTADVDADRSALDAWLADVGLRVEAPVQVLVAEAPPAPPTAAASAADPRVAVRMGVDAAWAAGVAAALVDADAASRHRIEAYGQMLAAKGPAALAAVATDGRNATVGLGFGVVDRGWLGVFGMVTSPAHRRRGMATRVVGALRAAAPGPAYLQVEVGNEPALALYRRLGFRAHHRYHYRSEPGLPSSP